MPTKTRPDAAPPELIVPRHHAYGPALGLLRDRIRAEERWVERFRAGAKPDAHQGTRTAGARRLSNALRRAWDALILAPRLLELLGELAPSEPMNHPDGSGCVWCNGTPGGTRYGFATPDPEDHSATCPWIAARRLLEARR